MSLDSLQSLFQDELKDIYHAEKQLLQALPRLAKAATTPELQNAFSNHLKETENHVARLEQSFKDLGMPIRGKVCKGMRGLVEEGKELMEEGEQGPVLDAALIGAAQRVEHYEIAAYGCLRTYAQLLGLEKVAERLADTLSEEEAADEKLNAIAEGQVNASAAAVGSGSEEESRQAFERRPGAVLGPWIPLCPH
jgi:ferritin-like metal-binding protein YciE